MSPRPLLLNGESLRQDLELRHWRGPGDKYEPRTAEQAREILLPQIETARMDRGFNPATPQGRMSGCRDYVVAQLPLPRPITPRACWRLWRHKVVGSRYAEGILKTKTKTARPSPTRKLILAVTDDGLEMLQTLVTNRGGTTKSERRAFEDIRTLNDFGLPRPDSILLSTDFGDGESVTVECVLHPTGINALGDPYPGWRRHH